jgi:hypothetical protein
MRWQEINENVPTNEDEIKELVNTHFTINSRYFNSSAAKIIINDDNSVTINGTCTANGNFAHLPVVFRVVDGSFSLDYCGLLTLEGCPREVINGSFVCRQNKITSLKGGPLRVRGHYNCDANLLMSLEGLPEEVGGSLIISWNPNLPLLRLLRLKKNNNIVLLNRHKGPHWIFDKYVGKDNSRGDILECQKEMIKAGFEGNASW